MKNPIGFRRVKFRHPFKLEGVEGDQLPGTYSVEVRDERSGWLKFLEVAKVSTWIRIKHFHGLNGVLKDFRILPYDLESALRRDKKPRLAEVDDKKKTFAPDSEINPVLSNKDSKAQSK